MEKILEGDWKKILTRPFSLFGASIWNEWYSSAKTKEILGGKATKGLFIESPKGMVVHFRSREEFDNIKEIFEGKLKENPEYYKKILFIFYSA